MKGNRDAKTYSPWQWAFTPKKWDRVLYLKDGVYVHAVALEVDPGRKRLLLNVDGRRVWDWLSNVRAWRPEALGAARGMDDRETAACV